MSRHPHLRDEFSPLRSVAARWGQRIAYRGACGAGGPHGEQRESAGSLARPPDHLCLAVAVARKLTALPSSVDLRDGVSLETSTLSDWIGATSTALAPLVDALAAEIIRSDTLHVDDTPVPVLVPGNSKTKPGLCEDKRPFGGLQAPALFRYSTERKGERPRALLKEFTGIIHADGYCGFNELFAGNRITEAGCRAHVRPKFFDVHAATASPIAKEALDHRAALWLYGVEDGDQGLLARSSTTRTPAAFKAGGRAAAGPTRPRASCRVNLNLPLPSAFRYMRARRPAAQPALR
jgi:hypothetical protein